MFESIYVSPSFFNGTTSSDTVYSQNCRMTTISPEPDYWIHTVSLFMSSRLLHQSLHFQCVELGKDVRPSKPNDVRGKGKGSKQNTVVYDYRDSSIHDRALRVQLLRGYEAFKVCCVFSTRLL